MRNTYVYKNIRLYFYFRRWYLCGAESNHREFAHTEELSGDRRASEQLTLAKIQELTLSTTLTGPAAIPNLTMVMPISHFFASHWLLAQAWFCGRTHLPLSPNSMMPTVQVIFQYLWPDAPVFNITTVGMVIFRQSPCWYYPWADMILSTSSHTQHMMTFRTWWHFGDHTGLINLSVNNIRCIHTRSSR